MSVLLEFRIFRDRLISERIISTRLINNTRKMITDKQKQILKEIDGAQKGNWNDWRWQVKHCIRDLDTFEQLLDIKLPFIMRESFKKISKKFPMSITPYYLSLIDTDNLENDPIFKQCFPVINELDIQDDDMSDPLHEDEDSPVPGVTHRYLTGYCFWSATPVQCIAVTAPGNGGSGIKTVYHAERKSVKALNTYVRMNR